jgi:hypothetical protein
MAPRMRSRAPKPAPILLIYFEAIYSDNTKRYLDAFKNRYTIENMRRNQRSRSRVPMD